MALRDNLPQIGGAAVAVDVLVNSGDLLVTVVEFLLGNLELLLPMVSYLNRLAKNVPWLPQDIIQTLLLALMAVFVLVYANRLYTRWTAQ